VCGEGRSAEGAARVVEDERIVIKCGNLPELREGRAVADGDPDWQLFELLNDRADI
jgi:hypothetical protein